MKPIAKVGIYPTRGRGENWWWVGGYGEGELCYVRLPRSKEHDFKYNNEIRTEVVARLGASEVYFLALRAGLIDEIEV